MTHLSPGRLAALPVAALLACLPTPASAGALIEGTWMTPDQAQMTIMPCEQGFCGVLSKIVITEAHVSKHGVDASRINVDELIDMLNENPALRGRPMLGLQILTLRASDNPWHFEGDIYNPQDGKTYSGAMDVTGPDTILLKGCALYVLCQEQTWVRVVMPEGDTTGIVATAQ